MRPIPGYDGYHVTKDGRVFSTRSTGIAAKLGRSKPPHEVRAFVAGAGYRAVTLGKNRKRYVHRLVAITYLGAGVNGTEVCHKDGDKNNNHYSNLEWKTHAENMRDNIAQNKMPRGKDNPRAKLTDAQAAEIKRLLVELVPHGHIARLFGVSQATVGLIATGKIWRHVPDPPGYENRRRAGVVR